MRAHRDDAPEHLKRKRKSPIGLATLTAAVLIAGTLFMADRNGWLDFAKHIAGTPGHEEQITSAAPPPTPSSIEAVTQTQPAQAEPAGPAVRQTSFNDSNYQPKRIINTIQPPPRQYIQARNSSNSNRQQQGLNGQRQVTLTWEDNRQKQFSWHGNYRWSNSRIMSDDLCTNPTRYRKGSIEYRGCRRAAKNYLSNQCRSQSSQAYRAMYCQADNGFRH